MSPETISAWGWLVETRIQSGRLDRADRTIQELFEEFPVSRIQSGLTAAADPFLSDCSFSSVLFFIHVFLIKKRNSLAGRPEMKGRARGLRWERRFR
jgi:hypothetical protein